MIAVCIDPGHAKGSDKHGCNGFSEQAHNLKMALALKAKLESTDKIKVYLTRSNETDDPSLTERGLTAARHDCALFLSMHTNGADGTGRGVTVYRSVDLPKDKTWAAKLAKAIASALGIPNRGEATRESTKYPNEDYYTVIDTAQDHGTPHVFLSESGFHDNQKDWAAINTAVGIEKIAEAHAKVLCALLGVTYPAIKTMKYVVVRGDTLWALAKRFLGSGTKASAIAKSSGIAVTSLLKAGQVLRIPTK